LLFGFNGYLAFAVEGEGRFGGVVVGQEGDDVGVLLGGDVDQGQWLREGFVQRGFQL
jgi:hypothetical protein